LCGDTWNATRGTLHGTVRGRDIFNPKYFWRKTGDQGVDRRADSGGTLTPKKIFRICEMPGVPGSEEGSSCRGGGELGWEGSNNVRGADKATGGVTSDEIGVLGSGAVTCLGQTEAI
jgi:hypothetical protein